MQEPVTPILTALFLVYFTYLSVKNGFIPLVQKTIKVMKQFNLTKPLKEGKFGNPDYLHKAGKSIDLLTDSKICPLCGGKECICV